MNKGKIHIVIPDTQVKPGVKTDHLRWIGQFITDKYQGEDVTIIHLGDHWDLPSLSSYDKGKKEMEGRRYVADIEAGNKAFSLLTGHIGRLSSNWEPKKIFLLGNHEARIEKASSSDAQLEGVLSYDDFNAKELGWKVVDFLKPIVLDGISYCHYFYNPMNSRPYTQTIENRLRILGHSFTMGHQQTLMYGLRFVNGKSQHGLVAGSCYLHDETYKGHQGNAHWRGIIVKHQVKNGSYDPMFVSLDYLCQRYEGKTLAQFFPKR